MCKGAEIEADTDLGNFSEGVDSIVTRYSPFKTPQEISQNRHMINSEKFKKEWGKGKQKKAELETCWHELAHMCQSQYEEILSKTITNKKIMISGHFLQGTPLTES